MGILEFMSDSPVLSFFIFLLICLLIESVVRAITGNYPPKDEG